MRRIAIITARGKSKRIPYKNIKEFCGKPIIAYSIIAAIESDMFDEIMVSTDDSNIADIARQYGANVPFFRSEKNADDYATTSEVLLEVIEEYKRRGQEFDTMLCLYPTAPFVTKDKIVSAINLLEKEEATEVMPVVAFSYPPQRGYIIEQDRLQFNEPQYYSARSQDLDKLYHDAGQFYCMNVKKFVERKGVIISDIIPLVQDELEVQDIDNDKDWEIAQIKYQLLNECREK